MIFLACEWNLSFSCANSLHGVVLIFSSLIGKIFTRGVGVGFCDVRVNLVVIYWR